MTSAPPRADERADATRSVRIDAVILAVVALILRLPALVATRHLTFDDGVYGASAAAMRAGGWPFRDVFSSQGPLFLPLVRAFDLLGFGWINAPRFLALAAGVALTLAAWDIARTLAASERVRVAGLAAGLLVATSGSVLWTTGPVASDGPALAFAAWAIALTLRWRHTPTVQLAVAIGALSGASFAIKSLLVVPPLLVVAALLLSSRRPRDTVVAAATGVGLLALAVLAANPADVWHQSVNYHLVHAGSREPGANAATIVRVLFTREWPLVLVGTAALGGVVVRVVRARSDGSPPPFTRGPVWPLWSWAGLALVVLLLETPMWRPHVIYLVVPLAILVALALPPLPVAVAAALLAVIPFVAVMDEYFVPPAYSSRAAAVVAAIEALPPGAQAIADDPGLVWRAGRETPAWFVDASRLRTETDLDDVQIDADLIGIYARRPEVCLVAVTSHRFANLEDLPDVLIDAGYRPTEEFGDDRAIWTKTNCRP